MPPTETIGTRPSLAQMSPKFDSIPLLFNQCLLCPLIDSCHLSPLHLLHWSVCFMNFTSCTYVHYVHHRSINLLSLSSSAPVRLQIDSYLLATVHHLGKRAALFELPARLLQHIPNLITDCSQSASCSPNDHHLAVLPLSFAYLHHYQQQSP